MLRFIGQNGLEVILMFLQSMNVEVRQSQLHFNFIGCIKALMNNPVCFQQIASSLKCVSCVAVTSDPLPVYLTRNRILFCAINLSIIQKCFCRDSDT